MSNHAFWTIHECFIVEIAERLAPLVATRGDGETSAFPAMAESSVVSVSAVGTASSKNAEGVRVVVS